MRYITVNVFRTRHLGMHVDRRLRWKEHITSKTVSYTHLNIKMNKFYFVYITNEYLVKKVNFVITNVVTWFTKYTILRLSLIHI